MVQQDLRFSAPRRIVVALINGNEKQRKAGARICEILSSQHDMDVELRLVTPCFARNWNKPLAEFVRHLDGADLAVVGTHVPTLLGKAARAAARQRHVPYRGTSALSAPALAIAIADAVAVLERTAL